ALRPRAVRPRECVGPLVCVHGAGTGRLPERDEAGPPHFSGNGGGAPSPVWPRPAPPRQIRAVAPVGASRRPRIFLRVQQSRRIVAVATSAEYAPSDRDGDRGFMGDRSARG